MEKKYFDIGPRFIPQCVTLRVVPPSYEIWDGWDIANFIDFWHVGGSRFCTFLVCETLNIVSQDFKNLYDDNGWTGLEFSEPIRIHQLKRGLVQPQNYYSINCIGTCDKVIAHKWEENHAFKFRTDWEVVNDKGFSFFAPGRRGGILCQEAVMKAILKRKFTNVNFTDFKTYRAPLYSFEDPDQMEF